MRVWFSPGFGISYLRRADETVITIDNQPVVELQGLAESGFERYLLGTGWVSAAFPNSRGRRQVVTYS